MGYSGAGGKLIHEKNQKQKSRDTFPLTHCIAMAVRWPGSPAYYTSSPACCTASSRSLYIYLLLAVQFQLYSPYCSVFTVLCPASTTHWPASPALNPAFRCIYSIYYTPRCPASPARCPASPVHCPILRGWIGLRGLEGRKLHNF